MAEKLASLKKVGGSGGKAALEFAEGELGTCCIFDEDLNRIAYCVNTYNTNTDGTAIRHYANRNDGCPSWYALKAGTYKGVAQFGAYSDVREITLTSSNTFPYYLNTALFNESFPRYATVWYFG